jgi:hypothetical protein
MPGKRSSTIKEQMELLDLTIPMLLEKISIVVDKLNEENSKMFSSRNNYKPNKNIKSKMGVSRATLYNIISNDEHTVSKNTAMIIKMAINETRKIRKLPEIDLDIKTYNSWERRK